MNNRHTAIILVFVLAAGGAVWWFLQPAPAEPANPAKPAVVAPKPAEAAKAAPIIVTPTKVAAPIAPPVAAPKIAAAPQPAPAPAANSVQVELNTAIDDMATMMQNGDMIAMMKKYMPPDELAQIPPEQMAQMEQMMQQQAAVPQLQQMLQSMSQSLSALKDQTPEMNAAGDQATYQMAMPAGILPPGANIPPTRPVTFKKIDGQWYIQNGPGGF